MEKNRTLFIIAAILIAIAALSRLAPHPPNMTPVTAIALFSAMYIRDTRIVFGLPLAALVISDILLYLVQGTPIGLINLFVYLSFAVIVLLGFKLKQYFSLYMLATTTATGSITFFLITNLAVWLGWEMYPMTWEGLLQCYVAALPFLRNMVIGDFMYTGLIFGAYYLATKGVENCGNTSAA
ncbi:MAG: DUF6580 family putative transport protein [Spirochaetota bacterium]